jgi:hypothetical protein
MSDNENVRTYRGVSYMELPAAWEVNVGDRVVCMLSDAVAAVEVSSITYREQGLTAYGLDRTVVVVFGYTAAPWWVDQLMMSGEITEPVCVAVPGPSSRPRMGTRLVSETPEFDADAPTDMLHDPSGRCWMTCTRRPTTPRRPCSTS